MYLKWDTKTITDFSETNINSLYNQGYLFTRTGKGEMYQTRSLRIDLPKFELSSENRRVLRKTEEIKLEATPLPYADYNWTIGKLGKDFYDTKFGDKTFSANKIKELLTEPEKSNFNVMLVYAVGAIHELPLHEAVGYTICYQNPEILHYCYPFYQLSNVGAIHELPLQTIGVAVGANCSPLPANLGLGMMLKAIMWAKEHGKKYIYLGSFQRPTDTYKLQFTGLEWWDGKIWETDLEEIRNFNIIQKSNVKSQN